MLSTLARRTDFLLNDYCVNFIIAAARVRHSE